jgi:hypothetical protein
MNEYYEREDTHSMMIVSQLFSRMVTVWATKVEPTIYSSSKETNISNQSNLI